MSHTLHFHKLQSYVTTSIVAWESEIAKVTAHRDVFVDQGVVERLVTGRRHDIEQAKLLLEQIDRGEHIQLEW